MVIDALPNAARYAALHPFFKTAFDFLQRPNLVAMPDGRHDLLDNNRLYALVQSYDTVPLEGGLLEGHRDYVDIQFILAGTERIGWAPFENQPVATPYDLPRDIAFYNGPCQLLQLRAGDFMILWPSDLHLPMRHAAETAGLVRKIVLKIRNTP